MTLTLKRNRFLELHVRFIKLSAAVHGFSC